jgi:DNA polymerase-1
MSYIVDISTLMKCEGKTLSLDTETTGLSWWSDKIIGLGFYCKELELKGYIPALDNETRMSIYKAINSFSSESIFIFHNAKFDMHFLKMNPRKGEWQILDTTIMIHLLDSRNRKALKFAEEAFLGTNSKREHLDEAPARMKIWDWPLELTASYCTNDAVVTYQLAEELYPRLEEFGLLDLFSKEMKYQKIIFDVEEKGVKIDETFIYSSIKKLEDNTRKMEVNLFDSCGNTFNWRSPQQLSKAIYGGLGIAKPVNPFLSADGIDHSRFADAGKYKSTCTSAFLLTEKVHHPLGELISSLRECDKIRKGYEKWLTLQDSDHLLHSTFNQTGTRTGRLSSSKPNLQNVASQTRGRFTQSIYTGSTARTDEFNMRKAIVAREGNVFLSVDYKQMEMRMFGILSEDPFMLEALLSGKDVHLQIALKVWGDCGEEMNAVHREWSKTITFGLIYGMTLGSLQYKLNMSRIEAAKITDQYWGQFPRIKPWMTEIIQSCKRDQYLRYWSGRYWREENPIDMYKGCNALIQGGCADLLSIAAMRADEWLTSMGSEFFLVSFVHDETISEVPFESYLESAKHVGDLMQVPDLLNVPFATECKVGLSYGEMYKIPKKDIEEQVLPFSSLISQSSLDQPEHFEEPEEEGEEEESSV